jgi:hypothetical protein
MLKDILKHDRKLEKINGKKHTKRRIVSVNLHAFFMNMVAEKLWNKMF